MEIFKNKKTYILITIIVIIIILLVCSCKKNNLIILSSKDNVQAPLSLFVEYDNYQNANVYLNGKLYDYNDKENYFFYNIKEGNNILEIKDNDGLIISTIKLYIKFENYNLIELVNEDYIINIDKNTTILELKLDDDEESTNVTDFSLVISNHKVYYGGKYNQVTEDKLITNFGNEVLKEKSIIITDIGILFSDGTFLGFDHNWHSKDKVYNVLDTTSYDDNIFENSEGDTVLSNGAKLTFYEEKTIVYFDGKEYVIYKEPEDNTDNDSNDNNNDNDLDNSNNDNELDDNNNDNELDDNTDTDEPDDNTNDNNENDNNETPDEEEEPEEDTVIWTQELDVELFDKEEIIFPGSTGEYAFELKNPYDDKMTIDILARELPHITATLPLVYRLKVNNEYKIGSASNWVTGEELKTYQIDFTGYEIKDFVLEWMWPYSGNDTLDTEIAESSKLDHIIKIYIYIEKN